ncbi:hypothetical protein L2E82_32121 [Cichorium intybus]|uniref:Uncharacterized protein n=1 Tax=Cichorium intybus TaxID=13427 RepID=A0ACB9BF43_CICIN|nr:hypothetical protein L2E82_32121 [Cichorium intybus]
MCFSFFLKVVLIVLDILITSGLVVSNADQIALHAIKSKITHDPHGVMKSWNDSHPFCRWQGVTCGRRHQRVTSLNLPDMGLVGTLSPYVGNLSFLGYIILDNNQLYGNIPPEVGHLFRLRVLSIPNNSFTNQIPTNISSCTKLSYIDFSYNMLHGKIPNRFSSLRMLKVLFLRKNNFTGGIPPSIGNLTSLEQLSLSASPLGGNIPDSFSKLKNLQKLGLGEMGLVGTFPSFLFNITMLELLNFPLNELVGSLPSDLCSSQPHLQRLEFSHNHFSGFLRPSMSNCSELQTFDVSDNDFKGEIPIDFGKLKYLRWLTLGRSIDTVTEGLGGMKSFDSLSNCSNLEVLEFENVPLKMELPYWLGNLTKLRYLVFQSSYISGRLPSSIGNLINLISLYLHGNNLTGSVPKSIGMLRNLEQLYLNDNGFSGIIPGSIGNLSSLTLLEFSRNAFEGAIPSTIGACNSLIQLSLAANNLNGSIPKEVLQLASLSVSLDLSQNNLSGVLPQEIGSLKNLGALDLSENHLSGELPSSFSSCTSLQFLYLSNNFFKGSIPESFSSLKALEYVNISRNNFSGHIPTYFQDFPLEDLDLSYNDFEGEVYAKGVFANASAISLIGNPRLCGGIPELHLPNCRSSNSKRGKKLSLSFVVAISLSSAIVGLGLVSFVSFYYCEKKKKEKSSEPMLIESFEKITYERLFKATEGFSSQNLIGTGSFASVYKGVLDENSLTVAIKVLNLQRRGGSKSFMTECDTLRHTHHRNLVKVITSCSSLYYQGNDFMALVYDFMPNGNLESWLHSSTTIHDMPHDDQSRQLDLLQRISIVKDVAFALDYLHYRCGNVVVHCDLKPSNILLDVDMTAHVGDFGLAKIISLDELPDANKSASSLIRGTVSYAPPEYGLGNEVSTSGDMYSYGILLLEMLTGKLPVDTMFQDSLSLHSYARMALTDRCVLQIVDPLLLNDDVKEACLISLVKIGVQCSSEYPQDRMNIGTVIHELLLGTACS